MMDVKLPNGEIVRDVPEGLSREEIIRRYVLPKKSEAQTIPEAQQPYQMPPVDIMGNPTDDTLAPVGATLMSGAIGTLKPIAGAAQFLGVNAPARKLQELSGQTSKIGGTAADIADFAGQMASPIPIKGANAAQNVVTQLAPKLAKSELVKGAVQGATSSAFNPVELGDKENYMDFLDKKLTDMGISAGGGAVIGKVAQGLMNPKVSDEVKKARDMGIELTPGQLLGFPNIEKKLTSAPISGSFVQKSLEDTNQQMNKAVANDALKHINAKLPEDVQAGSQMMEHLAEKVKTSYDNIADKINFLPDKNTIPFLNAVATKAAKEITRPDEREQFYEAIKNEFFTPLFENYKLNGKAFRDVESRLGTMANDYKNSANPFERRVGFALFDFQDGLRKELTRLNPEHAKELTGIHDFFKKYLVLQKAAGSAGAVNNANIFTPSQLATAARSMADKTKKATSKGLMMQQAQEYQNLLGKSVPDSGTAGRNAINKALGTAGEVLAGGAGAVSGGVLGAVTPILGMLGAYNPATKALLNTAVAGARPQAIEQAQPAISGALSRAVGNVDYTGD